MIILYFIIALIVASLSLYNSMKNSNEKWSRTPDVFDVIAFTFGSAFVGLFWFITIWVVFIKWAADGKTPYWAEALVELFNFIKGLKCRK